jgi:acyl carrier protein
VKNQDEIYDFIKESDSFNGQDIGALKETMLEDLPIDSMDMANFLYDLEEFLSISILDDEVPTKETLNQFVEGLYAKQMHIKT